MSFQGSQFRKLFSEMSATRGGTDMPRPKQFHKNGKFLSFFNPVIKILKPFIIITCQCQIQISNGNFWTLLTANYLDIRLWWQRAMAVASDRQSMTVFKN